MSRTTIIVLALALATVVDSFSFYTGSLRMDGSLRAYSTKIRTLREGNLLRMLSCSTQQEPNLLSLHQQHRHSSFRQPKYCGCFRIAGTSLMARNQDVDDDDDDDDDVDITTYLPCPKCMSDHFILREVLGEGRRVFALFPPV
jgi:hypothetical protein